MEWVNVCALVTTALAVQQSRLSLVVRQWPEISDFVAHCASQKTHCHESIGRETCNSSSCVATLAILAWRSSDGFFYSHNV